MLHVSRDRRAGRVICALLLFLFVMGAVATDVLARPRVALVLGGGSARGLSHIGLLKALEEGGIPIDYIIGTSMGSVVAGLYAAGFSADNLAYMVTNVNIAEMFVPTIPPKGGFLSTQRFRTFLNVLTDYADFASLPIPFYTVVIDLETGEEHTISSGSLTEAILASMSIPAMFPPVRIGDAYYVDGGMKSLVPVEVAKELGADLIIAVDVRRQLENINHDTVLSNVQLTLLFLLATDTPRQLELADVVIKPPVAFDSYMDYDRGDYFIQVGYEGAREAIPAIREALLHLDPGFPFLDGSPMYGYDDEVFSTRFRAAVAAAESIVPGSSVSPRSMIQFDGEVASGWEIIVPFVRLSETTPLFAGYAAESSAKRSAQRLSMGIGRCSHLCAAIFARRTSQEPQWGLGLILQGSVRTLARFRADWAGSGERAGAWTVRLITPEHIRLIRPQGEIDLTLRGGTDDHGTLEERLAVDLRFRYYHPWNRTDFWEAVSTSTNWFVGLGADATLAASGLRYTPAVEAGLAFEARLFGLYPLRSRLWLEYEQGKAPWTLRWTLGNWD